MIRLRKGYLTGFAGVRGRRGECTDTFYEPPKDVYGVICGESSLGLNSAIPRVRKIAR